jgi:serine/threonine protein kinase
MESASSPNHEASLLQRWFGPVSLSSPSPSTHHEHFSETDLRDISDVLRRFDRGEWSRIPRIYAVLRRLDRLEAIDLFLAQAISDIYFPFTHQTLPQSLNPSLANEFLRAQQVVLSSALDLERETGRHRHFSSSDDVPFIKLEDLGKGASGYVDRVISTVSHKEYARKLLPRGRTFRRNQSVLRSFQHELNALKKLCHHRHIVQLIGSYTDPQFVGIIMSPVADCDLKDFLISCVSDGASNVQARKSFIRSFFGCLTSALSYLHDNTIRHKDIKPQNVLVAHHTVYLTDFGISLDWSENGKETTTGPTQKTARYCAPEVSDLTPRNTSSDMWSLGCVFLEIWTVLKGETVAKLNTYLEKNGALSSCYHLNTDATFSWMAMLESKPPSADNSPLAWLRHLLVHDKHERFTARQLLLEIETVNTDPETKFAFSGQCCMEDLEATESVVSSNYSLEDEDEDRTLQAPSSTSHTVPPLDQERQPMTYAGTSALNHNTISEPQIEESQSFSTQDPVSNGTTEILNNVLAPSTPYNRLTSDAKVENGTLLAINQRTEPDVKGPVQENRSESLTPAPSNGWIDGRARPQSTHPEVSLGQLSAGDVPATSINPFIPPEHVSPNSDTSRKSNGSLTHETPVADLSEAEQAEEHDQDATLIDDDDDGDDEDNLDNMWSACTCNDRWNSDNELVPATHCVLHDDDNDNYPDYSFGSTTDSEDEASQRERLYQIKTLHKVYPGSSKNKDRPPTVAPDSSGRERSQVPSLQSHLETPELPTASAARQIPEPISHSLNEPKTSGFHTSPLHVTHDSEDVRSTSSREKDAIPGDITPGRADHNHQKDEDNTSTMSRRSGYQPIDDNTVTIERKSLIPHFSRQLTSPVVPPDDRLALEQESLRLPSTGLVSQNSSSAMNSAKKEKICGKCFETLGAQFVRALGQTFHLECYTCAVSLSLPCVTFAD